MPGLRKAYHTGYCLNCRTMYLNWRVRADAALCMMNKLGVGLSAEPWVVKFRTHANVAALWAEDT